MNCFLCKGDMESKLITHTVDLGSCIVIVRNVPALACTQCGEVWIAGDIAKHLECIIDKVTAAAFTEIAVVNYSENVA
jgi:YgiT-type zinc finger domain